MSGYFFLDVARLILRVVEQSRLPASSRDLLKRSEAEIFGLDPVRSDFPLRVCRVNC